MSSINRFTTSAANAQLEIAPALANLNFDFALYKVEAPKEFQGVGAALSTLRRKEAEDGGSHKTARQLGALFDRLLPATPEVLKAYGQRASEISEKSSVAPKPASDYGPFANRIGTDATSLWAAATSGHPAIAVHLLACMLAAMWDAPQAISIWVEIIERRKKEVEAEFERNNEVDFGTLMATRQDIRRVQLAEWDASARAWLQAANVVKKKQLTQLRLITDNIRMPVNKKADTYDSVIGAWTNSLIQMEGLIKGVSQQARSGDILLSLSSWHLFPNLMVASTGDIVHQHDPLFAQRGILTVGIESSGLEHKGVYWSLPLAHLRHYGAPVVSETSIQTSERSRISVEQLLQVTLGCVLQAWGPVGSNTLRAADWLSQLRVMLVTAASNGSIKAMRMINGEAKASWFSLILEAADSYVRSTGDERTIASKLVALGRRYGHGFLDIPKNPMFGAVEGRVLVQLFESEDDKIDHLREVAAHIAPEMRSANNEIFIRYKRHYPDFRKTVYEYASAFPLSRHSLKRKLDQPLERGHKHTRWLYSGGDLHGIHLDSHYFNSVLKPYGDASTLVSSVCQREPRFEKFPDVSTVSVNQLFRWHRDTFTTEVRLHIKQEYDRRAQYHLSKGEWVLPREDQAIEDLDAASIGVFWPAMGISCGESQHPWYQCLHGDPHSAALFVVATRHNRIIPLQPDDVYSLFKSRGAAEDAVVKALGTCFHTEAETHLDFRSLKALSSAVSLYQNLPNVSIDIRILQKHLSSTFWVQSCLPPVSAIDPVSAIPRNRWSSNGTISNSLRPYKLSRASAFACITMFESGQYNVNPAELDRVMAMSSGDSMYVGAALIQDPSEREGPGDIRRIIGNIGRPGIVFLVPPLNPMTKEVLITDWPHVSRGDFDGQLLDSFKPTSLHLSFTNATSPVNVAFSGGQDTEVYMLEALISIYDGGKWIADLDIYKALDKYSDIILLNNSVEPHRRQLSAPPQSQLTSIDDWYELLDLLDGPQWSIVRAHKNWQARLAAAALGFAKGCSIWVLPEKPCWECVDSKLGTTSGSSRVILIG